MDGPWLQYGRSLVPIRMEPSSNTDGTKFHRRQNMAFSAEVVGCCTQAEAILPDTSWQGIDIHKSIHTFINTI